MTLLDFLTLEITVIVEIQILPQCNVKYNNKCKSTYP